MLNRKLAKRASILAAAVAVVGLNPPAQAAPFIYEGFNTGTEVGWATGSTWAYATRLSGDAFTEEAGNIDFSDFDASSSGGKARGVTIASGTNLGQFYAYRQFGTAPTAGSTFWSSYLVVTGPASDNKAVRIGVDDSIATGSGTRSDLPNRFFSVGSGNAFVPNVGVDNTPTASTVSLAAGTAYLVISKWEDTNTDNLWDKGTMWVLTDVQYDLIKGGGVSDTELEYQTGGVYSNVTVRVQDTRLQAWTSSPTTIKASTDQD